VMSGRDTPADTITNNYAWKYVMTSDCGTYKGTCPPQYSWQPGVDPMCFDSKNPLNGAIKYSPGTPLVKRLVKDYPGYHFGIAQLSGSAWKFTNYLPTSGDYKAMVAQVDSLKPKAHIAGIIMIFNIVEIQYSNGDSTYADVVNYFNNIDTVITHFRRDVGIDTLPLIQSDYPVLGGKDTTSDYSVKGPWASAIRVLMRNNAKVPQLIGNALLIPTDSLTMYTEDGLYTHYNHNGDYKWANRVADSIRARNWGPTRLTTVALPQVNRSGISVSPALRAVFFNGTNPAVFSDGGNPAAVYLPNGKIVRCAPGAVLTTGNLRPGVYFVRRRNLKQE
jgi:Carbohydrate esterase, sialic acid-specific acetylesterase